MSSIHFAVVDSLTFLVGFPKLTVALGPVFLHRKSL
jgi:hypothetical protein